MADGDDLRVRSAPEQVELMRRIEISGDVMRALTKIAAEHKFADVWELMEYVGLKITRDSEDQ